MSDDKEQIKQARAQIAQNRAKMQQVAEELEKYRRRSVTIAKRLAQTIQKQRAVLDYVEGEIQRLEGQPSSPKRDRLLYMNRLRRNGLLVNIEMIEHFQQADPDRPLTPAFLQTMEQLQMKSDYIALDYQAMYYRGMLETIEQVLTSGASPAAAGAGRPTTGPLGAGAAKSPTGSLKPPTGPLGAKPGAPNRLGTGRLKPPGAAPARPSTGPLGRPTPVAGRTGPLGGSSGPLGGSGSLGSGPLGGTGSLEAEAKLQAELSKVIGQRGVREALNEFISRVRDLDQSLEGLRSTEEPGELALSAAEATALVKQAKAKQYYLTRTIEQLGPARPLVAYESLKGDPEVEKVLSSVQVDNSEPGNSEGSALADKLKSFFKL